MVLEKSARHRFDTASDPRLPGGLAILVEKDESVFGLDVILVSLLWPTFDVASDVGGKSGEVCA